ncbi:glycosyltransferase family 1 protein [Winogradskyella sp. F6397]|uniref:Glycosyltransferase family 1 protein n=1 Tax=Winogradskyella marina TaxID=2785530 RepID=A0ABS0EGJ1_9FLAO|nr:glycosyltransferase family 1 protein [Winogradskyella marina]MBF8149563.1 glycosyltransferase family 1 protein [Winogradskyella marina]
MNKDKPIRVLQVLTIMNLGGAETMIMNYYRHIDRTKVQFDFLLHRQERGFFDDEIESLGGKIYRMSAIAPKNYFIYKKNLNLFFDKHPDYKIVHSHLNALSSIILGVAKKKNIPFRIAHSHLAVEPLVLKKVIKKNTDIKATIKDSIQTLVKGRVTKVATHYFACGEKAGNWLFGYKNKTKVTIINNAINASLFTYDAIEAKKIKNELNLENKKVIGHIGRFNEQKNHFFLIKIFNELYKKDENCVLLLIGDGNLKTKLKEEAKRLNIDKNIHFLGLRDNIPELLQAFDLFLFPSLYEGLPVTLIEAQASGIKIITSNTVTKEVDITNLITYIDLDRPAEEWADYVLANIDYKRKNTLSKIKQEGYDIFENAKKLQNFYLNIN